MIIDFFMYHVFKGYILVNENEKCNMMIDFELIAMKVNL